MQQDLIIVLKAIAGGIWDLVPYALLAMPFIGCIKKEINKVLEI